MPPDQTTEHASQPVKKRSRFANVATQRAQNLPTHQRNVPAGFVRDLLDEEDSEDDPDFDGDIEISDEEEDNLDDLFDSDGPIEIPELHDTADLLPLNPEFHKSGVQPSTHGNAHHNEPKFEVDSLDSTDDEDDEDQDFENALPHAQQTAAPYTAAQGGKFINLGDIELNSEDEEDDPDFEATIDDRNFSFVGDVYDDDNDPGQSEARDDDYLQFLNSLLADNGQGPLPEGEGQTSQISTGIASISGPPSEPAPILAGDDDDDFDYLRASAMIRDDPLEYRDDLHVSRKEVAQLLFNNNESTLRRQTRTLKSRKAPTQSTRRLREAEPAAALMATPSIAAYVDVVTGSQPANADLPPQQGARLLSGYQPAVSSPQTQTASRPTSFTSLSPAQINKFDEQFGVHVQLLTHLHAVCTKTSRTSKERELTGKGQEEFDAQSDPHLACKKSKRLLQRILDDHRVSTSYHSLIESQITKMRGFSEGLLHHQGQTLFSFETNKFAAYDKPVIKLIDPFIRECQSADLDSLPRCALKPFEPFERSDVQQALIARPNQRQHTVSGMREGWFVWTAADDNLLAMTLAKYGRECGDYVRDLLPHRREEDCQARVRYLASRRCRDNAVKRQVLHISAPLSPDELRLVETGLKMFGGKIDDPNVWKQIQRQLLPTREWSHLQKLWLWRETRRRYKATYRAKLSKKKALHQGTVVG